MTYPSYLFGHYQSHWAAHEARRTAGDAKKEAADAERRASNVGADVDRLYLVVEALWQIVREQSDVTDEELVQRVQDIDLRDGVLDGKVAPEVRQCEGCGRRLGRRHPKCIYCGHDVVKGPFDR